MDVNITAYELIHDVINQTFLKLAQKLFEDTPNYKIKETHWS